ncbi:OmpA family protein [Aliishimia ponticola]|uniref:OmpA family protein n=1 Tax=Aliishimia ponticola TaxID=2499833 RepID=A0A4S4N9T7_9RHOB|nr:OmpA family protein [Aliishimia ponticola]THH35405.1 OmpA family protein [Aliishimia ponticola]
MIRWLCLLAVAATATGSWALDMPGHARLTAERTSDADRYTAPIAPFDGSAIPVQQIDGAVRRQAWELPGPGQSPLRIVAPLRAQFEADGFEIVLDCLSAHCGGFDFRFGTEVLPAPNMFVNLRDFQFLTLRKGNAAAPEAIVTLLVTALADRAYVQIIEARPSGQFDKTTAVGPSQVAAPLNGSAGQELMEKGAIVLDGVEFTTGATSLTNGPFPSLANLAALLKQNTGLRIALVGHTDSVGDLNQNIRISRARAAAVRQRLIDQYGIAPDRIEAEGMGYLAPRASNLTEQGREANRRVEAVVLANDR